MCKLRNKTKIDVIVQYFTFLFLFFKKPKQDNLKRTKMEHENKWEIFIEGTNMEFQQEWKKFIEERKQLEEKIKLFDELIKIDGEEWRVMIADLNKNEYEDRQRRFREIERDEQEDWDRVLKLVEEEQQKVKLFDELTNLTE